MNQQVQRIALCLPILLFFLHIGGVNTKGICLYASKKKSTWMNALRHCEYQGMCLADIDSAATLQEFITAHGSPLQEYWFGLNAHNKNAFRYASNDEAVKYLPHGSRVKLDGSCGYLKPNEGAYEADTANCDEYKKYICTYTTKCEGFRVDDDDGVCFVSEDATNRTY